MAQGATAAVVIVASATTTTILVTNPNFAQSALDGMSQSSARPARSISSPTPGDVPQLGLAADAQPCVTTTDGAARSRAEVASVRNSTAAELRDAEQAAQTQLQELKKAARDAEGPKLNDLVNGAGAKLKSRLTTALNDTAALTLGREGHQDGASTGPAAKCAAAAADAATWLAAVLSEAKGDFAKIVADATSGASAVTPTRSGGNAGGIGGEQGKDKAKAAKP